jgi:hypothetical protein
MSLDPSIAFTGMRVRVVNELSITNVGEKGLKRTARPPSMGAPPRNLIEDIENGDENGAFLSFINASVCGAQMPPAL